MQKVFWYMPEETRTNETERRGQLEAQQIVREASGIWEADKGSFQDDNRGSFHSVGDRTRVAQGS